MIQLFDTHRLPYRNAKLRAWALADKTRRINFEDYSSEDEKWNTIGTEVMTDESGYLFYGNGAHKVECLGVEEAAIVDVSLDGGQSYLIQFVIHADHDPTALRADDLFGLSFYDDNGALAVYNPAQGPQQLPDYLRRNEYSQGDWAEGTMIVPNSRADYNMTNFTHVILITSSSAHPTLVLPQGNNLRDGQVILIVSDRDTWLNIGSSYCTFEAGHRYLLVNYAIKALGTMLLDITPRYGDDLTRAWTTNTFTPAFTERDSYIWESAPICNNKIHENIVWFMELGSRGITPVSGHDNDIHIKVQIEPFKYDTIPFVICNLKSYSSQYAFELIIWLDFYNGDTDTGIHVPILDETFNTLNAYACIVKNIKLVTNIADVNHPNLIIIDNNAKVL